MKTTTKPVESSKIFSLKTYQLLQQNELTLLESNPNYKELLDSYNTYFILSCPKVFINPNYFVVTRECYEVEFIITLPTEIKYIKHQYTNKTKSLHLTFHVKDDCTNFYVEYNGVYLYGGKASALLDIIISKSNKRYEYMDYHVLYIGKSVGKQRYSNAVKRLKYHEQLKKINNLAKQTYPTKSIWLMLCSFKTENHTQPCLPVNYEVNIGNEIEQTNVFANDKLTKHKAISLLEANLINYFKPKYNTHYKELFPHTNHSAYNFAFQKDLNGIVSYLDFSEKNRYFYTKSVVNSDIHVSKNHFHNEINRMKMFEDF